jgi:hypothetical protein
MKVCILGLPSRSLFADAMAGIGGKGEVNQFEHSTFFVEQFKLRDAIYEIWAV